MEKLLFVVSSVTYAMRAQRLLVSQGIKATIGRSTRRSGDKSCSYTVAVAPSQAAQAEKILLANGVRIIGKKEGATT